MNKRTLHNLNIYATAAAIDIFDETLRCGHQWEIADSELGMYEIWCGALQKRIRIATAQMLPQRFTFVGLRSSRDDSELSVQWGGITVQEQEK